MYPICINWSELEYGVLTPNISIYTCETFEFLRLLPPVNVNDLPEESALFQARASREPVLHDPSTCATFGDLGVSRVLVVPVRDRVFVAYYWI